MCPLYCSAESSAMHRLHVLCLLLAAFFRIFGVLPCAGVALFFGGWVFVCSQDGLLELSRQTHLHGYPPTILVLGTVVLAFYVILYASAARAGDVTPPVKWCDTMFHRSCRCRASLRQHVNAAPAIRGESRPLLQIVPNNVLHTSGHQVNSSSDDG